MENIYLRSIANKLRAYEPALPLATQQDILAHLDSQLGRDLNEGVLVLASEQNWISLPSSSFQIRHHLDQRHIQLNDPARLKELALSRPGNHLLLVMWVVLDERNGLDTRFSVQFHPSSSIRTSD